MKLRQRYLFLLFFLLLLVLVYVWKTWNNSFTKKVTLRSIADFAVNHSRAKNLHYSSSCNMANSFDWSKCAHEKVYVYESFSTELPVSPIYKKVLKSLRESSLYTNNYTEACLFVLAVDTSDRDKLSNNYIKDIDAQIARLPVNIWNDGVNHLIFNFYSGSFPIYEYNLGFNTGKAIIAWASANLQFFRPNFDISFPLFHKEHPFRTIPNPIELSWLKRDRYLASFKGKRYVFGIGSDTRNILYKLHNNESFIIATTCKHTVFWKKFEDDRCFIDNQNYDNWDYTELLHKSTFCFTPRGRRVGSFRFLDALGTGCIPIILSDDWILPFSEFIDWSRVVVRWPESDVLFLADYLLEMSDEEIFSRKLQSLLLYHRYFSSIENIVFSSVKSVLSRINRQKTRRPTNWNTFLDHRQDEGLKIHVLLLANSRNINQLNLALQSFSNISYVQQVSVFCPFDIRPHFASLSKYKIASERQIGVIYSEYEDDFLLKLQDFNADNLLLFYDDRHGAVNIQELEAAIKLAMQDTTNLFTFHVSHHTEIDSSWTLSELSTGSYSFALLDKTIVHADLLSRFQREWRYNLSSSPGCSTVLFNVAFAQRTLKAPRLVGSNLNLSGWLSKAVKDCFGRVVQEMYENRVPLISSSLRYSL